MNDPLQVLSRIPSKIKASVIVLAIIFVLIWFVLPHLSINGSYPFAGIGMRILILCIAISAYELRLIVSVFQKYKAKTFPILIDKIKQGCRLLRIGGKNGWQYSKDNLSNMTDKIKKDQKRRRLRRQPWYLVLGAPNVGKKSVIKNLGLHYSRPEHFGEEAVNYINQFPDYEWWFSEQGVFVDAMGAENESSANTWKRFLKLLRRERKNKPLNGILLVFNLSDLVLYSNKSRQDFIQDICTYIRDIHQKFKSLVPVYVVFNKCDLVEGFMEFFNDLSKEELRQVWGMSLPLENCNELQYVQRFFENEYNALIAQLRKRVMWALDTERSIRGRELINAFPQQMQLLKRPIENFISELFGSTRYHNALQLRGVYFTSCDQQEGEPYDFVLQAMSKKFQLVPPKFERPSRLGECYFLRTLFFDIMLPESHLLGDSERSKRIRRAAYRTLLLSCPALVIFATVGMYVGYQENLSNLNQVDQYIQYYNEAQTNVKQGDDSLLSVLSVLNPLKNASLLYSKHEWGLHFLYVSQLIGGTINDALQRTLHSEFLPRIAAQIENNLNQNIQDQNLLYATLKGYLAFSASNDTPRFSIKAPMEYGWNNSLKSQPQTVNQLKYYLTLSLNRSVEKLPLDNALINRVRGQLEQIIPSQRAYGLLTLRASVNNLADLLLNLSVGTNFNSVFEMVNPKSSIPSLYTARGFQEVFLKQDKSISKEVAEDNRDIGLVNESNINQNAGQISDVMQKNYNDNYIESWDNALANIKIKPFQSLDDAINTFNLLISKQSSLPKLLDIVYDNTASISHDKVQVTGHYDSLNNYSKHAGSGVSWPDTVKTLENLRDYLVTLQQAANQNQASFNAALELMQAKNKNPIQALSEEAVKAPKPVQRWLNSLANNSWQIIVQGAHAQMNDAWKNDVMSNYDKSIRDRFPLRRKSQSDIAMTDFNTFFSNGGTLQTYFNTYIKPFVNTDKTPWTLYQMNGHSIELPDSSVKIFESARAIREDYFVNGAKQANFSFSIEPITLDSNASSVQMIVGPNHLTYSHGPRNVASISWPMPFNAEQTSLYITTFNDNQYGVSASGPWSLFKIFNHGVLKPTQDDGTYLFYINFHGYSATYRITGTGDIGIFKLTHLNGFKLPNKVAPNVVFTEKPEQIKDVLPNSQEKKS